MEDSITKVSIRVKSMDSSGRDLVTKSSVGSVCTNRRLPKDKKLKMLAHGHATNIPNKQQTYLLDCNAMQLKHSRRHASCTCDTNIKLRRVQIARVHRMPTNAHPNKSPVHQDGAYTDVHCELPCRCDLIFGYDTDRE
jgi:hypothetical protein